jgi:hypothetical protein
VCDFEVAPVSEPMTGRIEAAVFEVGGTDPTSIIGSDQSWYVRVRWQLQGILKRHMCGTWCVCAYLETCGPGNDIKLGCKEFPIDPCQADDYFYTAQFDVTGGSLTPDDCGTLYCVCIVLTTKDPCGDPGHISGFCREACVLVHRGPIHGGAVRTA